MTDRSLRRIGILGSPLGPYVQQLESAARARKHPLDVHLLSFADLTVQLSKDGQHSVRAREHRLAPGTGAIELGNSVRLDQLDAIVVRTMPIGSLEQVIFRMDALQVLEGRGVVVVNPAKTLEVAIDKWLTLHRLARTGIPVPPTIACQTRDEGLAAWESLGGDVVVKPLFGGEGRGIVRVDDRDLAWRVFSTLEQLRSVIYVQPFLSNFGYDIRVLKIGSTLYSVKRRAADGNWRTNVSQAGKAEPHDLSEHERQLALASAEATGGNLLGIDLLPTTDGNCVVLEVNAVPGWNGTQAALGIDVSELILQEIERLHVQ